MDRENSLEEVGKAYIKEKYSRIGKTEKDGIIIDEIDKDSEWMDKKLSTIYVFEEKISTLGEQNQQAGKETNVLPFQ